MRQLGTSRATPSDRKASCGSSSLVLVFGTAAPATGLARDAQGILSRKFLPLVPAGGSGGRPAELGRAGSTE
jgi:hypothetical protein